MARAGRVRAVGGGGGGGEGGDGTSMRRFSSIRMGRVRRER